MHDRFSLNRVSHEGVWYSPLLLRTCELDLIGLSLMAPDEKDKGELLARNL